FTGVAPEAYRGAVLGIVVVVLTLPGIIAPLVTGLLIQSSGKNVVAGFHNAYLLASLLLLVSGVAFLAFARPDDQQFEEKRSIGVVGLHEESVHRGPISMSLSHRSCMPEGRGAE